MNGAYTFWCRARPRQRSRVSISTIYRLGPLPIVRPRVAGADMECLSMSVEAFDWTPLRGDPGEGLYRAARCQVLLAARTQRR